ncbi:TetR/AcrR family transcriptional regulator [Pseudonocardia sp. Cha107L01]|uniref:TetR/AcrR family transcriptional regulator n=1 Tax=Pseudonocardia sp. Cha107L01 TaxID=3457576 RepID=UPI00403EE6BC
MAGNSSKVRRRPGPRPKYSRSEVLDAALRLVDREPPDKFSMRRLADDLGLGTMTVYGYFPSREELLEAVTSHVFNQGDRPRHSAEDAPWDVRLRGELRDLHRLCRRHPNLVTLILGQLSPAPGIFRLREQILGLLLDGGLSEQDAVHALGVLTYYVLGFSGAQARHAPVDLPERIEELSAEEFPRLTAVASMYASHLSDPAFEYGLDLLVGGLANSVNK